MCRRHSTGPESRIHHERLNHHIMNDSIGLYLNDIGKVPLLTAEDERELSRVIEAGREAAEQLANGKRSAALKAAVAAAADAKDRFIRVQPAARRVSIARRYPLPQGMDLLDLIQEGNLGLEHAVDKFDWRAWLQVLHLRHVLDPPGHRPGARPEGQPHPHPRRPLGQPACRPAPGLGRRRDARPDQRRAAPPDHAGRRSTRPSATTATPRSATSWPTATARPRTTS